MSARLIHISTDFVFDGNNHTPYRPDDLTNPVSVYGKTKRDGEIEVQKILGSQAVIIRTAWLYSAYGNNFVKTMLRLMAVNESLNIVADQKGSPTWVANLAKLCWEIVQNKNFEGIHHYTDNGEATWYDFAVEIQKQAISKGLLSSTVSKKTKINPIPSSEYPTPARRPSYSVLNTDSLNGLIPSKPWQAQLSEMLNQIEV
jgi:dTDP-4-dehydrorhamnose reductase